MKTTTPTITIIMITRTRTITIMTTITIMIMIIIITNSVLDSHLYEQRIRIEIFRRCEDPAAEPGQTN